MSTRRATLATAVAGLAAPMLPRYAQAETNAVRIAKQYGLPHSPSWSWSTRPSSRNTPPASASPP